MEDFRKHEMRAEKMGLPWRNITAVVVEALPDIIPDKEPWEKDWEDLRDEYDLHGRMFPSEYNLMDPTMEAVKEEDLYALAKEAGFEPAPRITEADKSGDRRTMNRRLWERRLLVVKRDQKRPGPMSQWCFPFAPVREEDHTMMEVAERVVAEQCGRKLETFWLGRAPVAWWWHPYPNDKIRARAKAYGEQVFFYSCQYIDGNFKLPDRLIDHAWVTRDELQDYFPEDFSTYMYHALYST
eukprot:CAMPEP_0113944808 /NCGR_PEP_ID=MMETSP1339-20121228/36976_1 /TAXON_ID=94617 /ORGANISM="Fibrocapsa japonica" /LENGTH=239 /DNA_ID=CAMNT_0000950131 /DNA_START=206 /DNA_END=925 /DNA_ORIENTATION=- /assembly_acc=CAM_ASM_000762